MVDGLRGALDPGVDLLVGLHRLTRRVFRAAIGIEGRLTGDIAHHLDPLADGAAVLLGGQVVGEDGRMIHRIGRAQPHPPAAFRTQLADVEGEAVLGHSHLAVVLHDGQDAVDLQVGPIQVRARAQEGARFQELLAPRALVEEDVVHAHAQRLDQALSHGIGGDRLRALPGQGHVQVVLQIGANALQLMHQRNAVSSQFLGIADARQLQDLRRLHGAGAEQNLGVRVDDGLGLGLVVHVLDADRAPVLDDDAGGARAGQAGQVRPLQGGMQIAAGGAPALAVMDGQLIGPPAFLLEAVEILGDRVARLTAGLDGRRIDRIGRRGLGDLQRAIAPVPGVAAPLQGLGTFEIGQHLGIGPAGQAHLAPLVIVPGMAADIDHAVDRGRSAPAAAAGPPQLAVVQVGLGLGPEAPVVRPLLADQPADPGRHLDHEGVVAAARLQQQHLGRRVLAEPVGEHAARRACADDDVVVPVHDRPPLNASSSGLRPDLKSRT